MHLLLGGLELLVGALELLVDAEQLLVAGQDLLIGRDELLAGHLVRLHERLDVVLRGLQVLAELVDPDVRGLRARRGRLDRPVGGRDGRQVGLLEQDDEVPGFRGPVTQGDDLHGDAEEAAPLLDSQALLGTVAWLAFASAIAARSSASRPPRTIFSRSRLAMPGAGSRKRPVCPRNCKMVISSSTRTPGGENRDSRSRSASCWTSSTPRPSGAGRLAFGRYMPPPRLASRSKSNRIRAFPSLVELAVALDQREQLAEAPDRLGGPQHQVAARLQRVVEERNDLPLEGRVEVDEHIAATDQVEPREGRVTQQVVPREHAEVADRLGDLVMVVDAGEVPPEPFRRDVPGDVLEVQPCAGPFQGRLVDVGGEDLDRRGAGLSRPALEQGNRQRVHLLAGGTSRHPDADRHVAGPVPDQVGQDSCSRNAKAAGSRKKLVTRMSMSWKRASISAGSS